MAPSTNQFNSEFVSKYFLYKWDAESGSWSRHHACLNRFLLRASALFPLAPQIGAQIAPLASANFDGGDLNLNWAPSSIFSHNLKVKVQPIQTNFSICL